MRKLKKGVPPSPVNYSLIGKFTHNDGEWFVYQRHLNDDSAYCNMKVIHPAKIKSGSANLWLDYRLGEGDKTSIIRNRSTLDMHDNHHGLEDALMAFCREKMPETFD